MRARSKLALGIILIFVVSGITLAQAQKASETHAASDVVLKPADISGKLFPEHVFFRGQLASVQMRNTGGVRFTDDLLVLAGLVDNSGYSTSIREKYQGYLITEVPLDLGGQHLAPGAYGFGFLDNNKFTLMDLASNDLLTVASVRDAEIKHPTPLQVLAGSETGKYRLYKGREFVEFGRRK